MNNGRFYGKIVDEKGKGIGYATIQLFSMRFDSTANAMAEVLVSGQISEDNGDFSLENLPAKGPFTLKVSFLGYAETSLSVSFDKPSPTRGNNTGNPWAGGAGMGSALEKDLGNILLSAASQTLETVTVRADASTATLALDKKIYRVDKDASTAGGTAQDALKNVPSLSVDIDGNVSLRNGSPQIFVDGRPTTLSLDQIAADAIETVEVITNPSAKYDAGGGTAGIINIVLKKEKKLGYNGNVRLGTDSRQGYNLGADINARGEKINLFGSAMVNNRKGFSVAETSRENTFGTPPTRVTQSTDGLLDGTFANARAGIDWFADNRNTFTFSGSFTRGHFEPFDDITTRTDSLFPAAVTFSEYLRSSDQDRNFRNLGSSIQYKRLFPKAGAEWTADLNYNRVKFFGESNFNTRFDSGLSTTERQQSDGEGNIVTFQTDFVNPLSDQLKWEGGLRASLRKNVNMNKNQVLNTDGSWNTVESFANNFAFFDNVFAAYSQLGHQFDNWGYQVGLRAESSFYGGELTDRDSSFQINYPISLFPSIFFTRKINDLDNIQFAYTRRINRPNFFQTMPFIDFSDSLNLRRGEPTLRPEFMHSMELSYQNVFKKGHNLLISLYFKQANDLITTYQLREFNETLGKEVLIFSFQNANSSQAYGAELTLKNSFFNVIDLTTNVNLYQSKLDASNVENDLVIDRFTWFAKEIVQIKLPAGFSLQFSGEYRSRASFTPNESNRMPWMAGPTNTAQGYTLANWFVDATIRRDFLNRKASLTLGVNDIFRSRRSGTYTASALFIQDTWRIRDPQIFRLNFSYRFGKMDTSIFKRKNMRMNMQGSDMMG
ncbi:MAG: hypothetical protein RLY31_483 [Bacteroidota bacterium]